MQDADGAFGQALPKHRALQHALAAIAAELGPGISIPSERDLMNLHSVSRATVRKAVDSLVHDGLLKRVQGKGTFVTGGRVQSTLHLASFSDDMRRRGLEPTSRVIALSREPTCGSVAAYFGGSAGWRLERLRLADGVPMALEVDWVNAALVPELDAHDLTRSLYTLLATQYASPIDTADQTVGAGEAEPWVADLLDVPVGAPLMVFERRSRSDSQPIEHVTSWYRGDRYALHMSLDQSMRDRSAPRHR